MRTITLFALLVITGFPRVVAQSASLDKKVQDFLKSQSGRWRDLNVSDQDGQVLYNLIVENNYRNIVEIGTSTGHSTIWMAWAASKTGGKVITIEISERRYKQALANTESAGLSAFVDARLADAHSMVKELNAPVDFVFSDADKPWYKQYFVDLDPKIKVNGCFTAHNVLSAMDGIPQFLSHIRSLKNYQTTIDRSSSEGISISFKKQ